MRARPLTVVLALFLTLIAVGSAHSQTLPPPTCEYGSEPAPMLSGDPLLALVDTSFHLPSGYAPTNLVSVRTAGLDDDRTLIEPAVRDLKRLLEAAARQGLHYELQSAYRSYGYQEQVFSGWVATLGEEQALLTSARPGHSEHQLGTALDLRSAGGPAPWDLEDWAQTPEGEFMAQNSWKFGFVMSYPEDSQAVSCYAYEPWHFRWVGEEIAARVAGSGLTLREWLWHELQEEER